MLVTRHPIRLQEVEHLPRAAEMEQDVLYLSRRFAIASHLCACGCGGETVTPVWKPTGWDLSIDADDRPTLHPSIGNQRWPCESHYWIQNGEIVPCA